MSRPSAADPRPRSAYFRAIPCIPWSKTSNFGGERKRKNAAVRLVGAYFERAVHGAGVLARIA